MRGEFSTQKQTAVGIASRPNEPDGPESNPQDIQTHSDARPRHNAPAEVIVPASQVNNIRRYFEIDIKAATEELYKAAQEQPHAPPAILADISRMSGWGDAPDIVIVTPKSGKWNSQDGGMVLGNPDGTGAIILEPGTYAFSELPITGLTFTGTSAIERQAPEWNSNFRIAVGWYTRAPN